MSNKYGAYLYIPDLGGKILLPPDESEFHIGRYEIQESCTVPIMDPNIFSPISAVKRDSNGNIIKEHFIIYNNNGSYSIIDKNSTNGTYLNGQSIKNNLQTLKDGDKIIVPIQTNNQLRQLSIFFYYAKSEDEIKPIKNQQAVQSKSTDKSIDIYAQQKLQAEYYEPPSYNNISSPTAQTNSQILSNPFSNENSTGSFILIHRAQIPPNAFSPSSGIDFSWAYRIEKSEKWHIFLAFMLLFTMIYHTYINLKLIDLARGVPFNANEFFLEPIPIATLFGISFIVHEYSHLTMGKKCGYQSRFCLTKKGVKMTLISAIIGIPFGLPGAAISVGIDPVKDKNNMGKIKVAGPLSNLIFGLLLILIAFALPTNELISVKFKLYLIQGASLNFILGCFNLLPIKITGLALDGENIIKWNKKIYFTLVILFIIGIVLVLKYFQSTYQLYLILSY